MNKIFMSKILIIVVTLLIATPSYSAKFGDKENLLVGGQTFLNPDDVIVLTAFSTTANRYHTFRDVNGIAGYTVTSGKTLTIHALKAWTESATGTNIFNLMHGTSDIGTEGVSAPTEAIAISSYGVTLGMFLSAGYDNADTAIIYHEFGGINFDVPSGRTITSFMIGASNGHVTLYATEN